MTFFFFAIFFHLEDDQVAELEEKSVEIFTEGLSALAGGQEVNSTATSSETELWTRYISWCEERQQDKNASEGLKKKVSGQFMSLYMYLASFKVTVEAKKLNYMMVATLTFTKSVIHSR